SNWQEFVDKKLGYRATFPGTPKVKMSNMRDEKGNAHEVYNCGVEFNEGRTKYAVQCELQVAEAKIEDMKEIAKNAVAKWSKLKYVKSAKEVQAGDYAGFETLETSRFKGTRSVSRTRYYWIGKVTYHVYVRAPEGELDEKAASRFLDSFAVLSAAERKRDA